MAINAYEVILTKYPGIKQELDLNPDVSVYLMSVFQQLPILMREGRIDPRDLKVDLGIDDHDRLKVTFVVEKKKHSVFLGLDPQILYKRNAVIVRVLEANAEVVKLVPKLVDALTEWAHARGMLYQDVRISETKLMRGHLFSNMTILALIRPREYADDLMDSETTLFIQEEAKKETADGRVAQSILDHVKKTEDKKGHAVDIILTDK